MKRRITFALVLCLQIIFTYGQSKAPNNTGKFGIYKLEDRLTGMKQNDNKQRLRHPIQKSNNFQFTSRLKSNEDVQQKLDSLINYRWNKTANQWVVDYKFEFTYDSSGNATQDIGYEWNETNSQWVPYGNYEFSYNANGKMTQEIVYDWDETTRQWVLNWKYEYSYDANGNITQNTDYHWDESTSKWLIDYKIENTYNASGNMMQEIVYNWNETTLQLVAFSKYEYSYDAKGSETQKIAYTWDKTLQQWKANWKYENTYDANGKMMQRIDYDWYETTSQWVLGYKSEFTYDANGKMTRNTDYHWDESTSKWLPFHKAEYTYDNTYTPNNLILPYNFNHMFTQRDNYENDGEGNWVIIYKLILFYSEKNVTNINNTENINIAVYPNPVSDYLNFSFTNNGNAAKFELFDLNGRKIISKAVNNSETINMKGFNSGIYFYNLYIGDKKQSGKIMKD